MDMQIEHDAADLLLDRRKRLPMPAPFFLRWFGIKEIGLWVKSNRGGTSLRVSRYYAKLGITQETLERLTIDEALKLHASKGVLVSKIVACAILNGYLSGALLTSILAFYIRWNADPAYQFAILNWLLLRGDTGNFISTIRSASKMRVTMPILSQGANGS